MCCIILLQNLQAQKTSDILKQQAGEGVKEGAKMATQDIADKTADKVLNSIFSKKNKKKNNKKENSSASQSSGTTSPNSTNSVPQAAPVASSSNATTTAPDASFETYSKYDFVPGAKVLVYEDFSQDNVGEFPGKWNTNSSGEVVTLSNEPGHWLMLNKKGLFMPEYIKELPDNFTLEFDLLYVGATPWLDLYLLTGGTGQDALKGDVGKRSGVNIGIQAIPRDKGGLVHIYSYNDGNTMLDNQTEFSNNGNTKMKISIWRQKQRLRVYLDQNKLLDLPKAFPADKKYDNVMFYTWSDFEKDTKYLIGNIKLAVGDPDTRNKLISEGKFSTTGILFDVNSSNIKPESYGSIKDIADVLKDNTNIRVKIIGHTDSDGDHANNVILSRKRAEAVKAMLESEFNIDASRMQTDGKGDAEPAASNSTPEGKAQNRRVEFIKI